MTDTSTLDAELMRLREENERLKAALEEATARPKAEVERELASQRALTQRIVDHAPIAIAFVDRGYVTRRANATFCRIARRAEADLVGQTFRTVAPESAAHLEQVFEDVAKTRMPVHGAGVPLVLPREGLPDQSYWDFVWVPVIDENDELEGVLTLAVEVTERVARERLQQEQIERLEELDRLKTNIVHTVTHEFRTPLTSLVGYAAFLMEGVGQLSTTDQTDFLAAIQRAAARLTYLSSDLAGMTTRTEDVPRLQLAPVDLHQILADEVRGLAPQADAAGVALVLEPAEPIPMQLDPRRIGQVVINLVTNALNATPRGGSVRVRVLRNAVEARIEVVDTGVGVAREHLPRLFERFYQVDSSQGRGTGLGLAIARMIVAAHGGAIGAISQPDLGSTFWFTLPFKAPTELKLPTTAT